MQKLGVFLNTMGSKYNFIDSFNPDIVLYSEKYKTAIDAFDAGLDKFSFNEFIKKEADEYKNIGDGVTYLVFNKLKDAPNEIVAYFTLCSGAIPYVERWKVPVEEQEELGVEYEEVHCGIPAIELKMFAVSQKYQDIFYQHEDEQMPVSAWILMSIIDMVYEMKSSVVGIKALYLRSVPSAENFYKKNGFDYVLKPMNPFYCIDDDFKAMYIPFVQTKIHYD